jgi:hypothetical protein
MFGTESYQVVFVQILLRIHVDVVYVKIFATPPPTVTKLELASVIIPRENFLAKRPWDWFAVQFGLRLGCALLPLEQARQGAKDS